MSSLLNFGGKINCWKHVGLIRLHLGLKPHTIIPRLFEFVADVWVYFLIFHKIIDNEVLLFEVYVLYRFHGTEFNGNLFIFHRWVNKVIRCFYFFAFWAEPVDAPSKVIRIGFNMGLSINPFLSFLNFWRIVYEFQSSQVFIWHHYLFGFFGPLRDFALKSIPCLVLWVQHRFRHFYFLT